MAKICLTVRYTNQTEIFNKKVGHSDPIIFLYGQVIAQRIKGTLGITG